MKKLLTLLLMPLLTLSALGQNLDRTYKQQEEMLGGGMYSDEVRHELWREYYKVKPYRLFNVADVSAFLAKRGFYLWLASDIIDDPKYGKVQNYIWVRRTREPKIAEMLVSVDFYSGRVFYRGRQYAKAKHAVYEGSELWRLYDEPFKIRGTTQEGKMTVSFPYPRKDIWTEKDVTEILEPYWIEKEKWLKLRRYRQGSIVQVLFVKPLYYDLKVEVKFQVRENGLAMYGLNESSFPDAVMAGSRRFENNEEDWQDEQRLAVIFKLLLCHLFPPCKQSFSAEELQMPYRKTDMEH